MQVTTMYLIAGEHGPQHPEAPPQAFTDGSHLASKLTCPILQILCAARDFPYASPIRKDTTSVTNTTPSPLYATQIIP